ncbi:hypothetical protein BJI67_01185 [Acidihalobacter aeolianus]|uniref:DUF4124 domain-containing protein n=1 Tax=Acidihalobacter aeolianus TaxID=2792603 RepID=A0A1D8K4H5_9GAMM|nr:DUF4124 domain-containing protein [Acidihalobacter aeolianus]AOV15865.1 hypothetical protein BJI67_01185 [Acidihalobacter aeolianus]
MKRLAVMLCLLLFAASAQATIYRWINAQGNVVFSDTPPTNGKAQVLQLNNSLITVPAPQTSAPSAPPATSRTQRQTPVYRSLTITSPTNGQAIRANNGDISISLNLTPTLLPGDRIHLFMDGVEVYSGTSTQIPLNNVNRGTHTAYAAVVTQTGLTAIRSQGVSFTVLRHSILFHPPKATIHP